MPDGPCRRLFDSLGAYDERNRAPAVFGGVGMFEWFHTLSPDNQGKVIAAAAGIFGTLLGAGIGGTITWRLTRSTQRLQQAIADAAVANQRALATNTLKAQERTAIDALLAKMTDFMMAYPFVENEATCHK